MDFFDFADHAVLHELDRAAVFSRGVNLDAHLGDEFLFASHLGEPARLEKIVGERLLPIDGEPTLHCGIADARVHVVWGGDVHRLQILLLVEQFAKIGIQPRLGEFLAEFSGLFFIHVAARDDTHIRMAGDCRHVRPSHAGGAERGVVDDGVRRLGTEAASDERCGGGAGSELLEKGAAGEVGEVGGGHG